MYVYKSMVGSRVTNAHHIINSALTGLRSPAGPRRLGTATRISASLSRRLSAFFESTSRPRSQSGKVRRSDTRPGDVRERAERSESSDTTPIRNAPCFGVCALVCDLFPKAECVPAFTCENEREPFAPEVLKAVRPMCWKRWYDCVSCAFRAFFEDEKESRIKGWRRNRRSAQSLLPAVRAVFGFLGWGQNSALRGGLDPINRKIPV